jgi:hypothetical protein
MGFGDFIFLLIVICTCLCQSCDVEIYPNFYIHKKQKYITCDSIKNDRCIYLNGNQIFDQNLLIDFDQQLIQNTVSFEGYTSAYNAKIQIIATRENQHVSSNMNNDCNVYVKILEFRFMFYIIGLGWWWVVQSLMRVVKVD